VLVYVRAKFQIGGTDTEIAPGNYRFTAWAPMRPTLKFID